MVRKTDIMHTFDRTFSVVVGFEMDESDTTTSPTARVNQNFDFIDLAMTRYQLLNILLGVSKR